MNARGLSDPRVRLAQQAAHAGYSADTLVLVASLTFGYAREDFERGLRLSDHEVDQLIEAVEVCAQANLDAERIGLIAHHCRQRAGSGCWRREFWRYALALANARAAHPEFHAPRERPATAAARP